MTHNTDDVTLADFLSDISVATVVALQTRDQEAIDVLSSRLTELESEFAEDQPKVAAYFGVLQSTLQGEDVSTAAEKLEEPFRTGYERIVQELEKQEDISETRSEWVSRLTTIVVTTMRKGSDEDRADLEQELADIAREIPAEEIGFQSFIAALRGVLRDEDARELALELKSPYREAYQSMLQLLTADDTTDFAVHPILDRIQHNTIVTLTQGNERLRFVVAEALADLEEKLPEDEPTTPHFRALILGALALLLDREPPAAVNSLPEPFAEAWQNIVAASQQT